MNKVDILELLNMADGNSLFDGQIGFVVSKRAPIELIRQALIEALGELNIFDFNTTDDYKYVASSCNYYSDEDLNTAVGLVFDFASLTLPEIEKTVWFDRLANNIY